MVRILLAIISLTISFSAQANFNSAGRTQQVDEMEVKLSIGFGYHLCGRKQTLPPLETAYLCPGLQPSLKPVVVKLKAVRTSKPEWKMWSGEMTDEVSALNVNFKYELLISYADLDGKIFAFIDGRIIESTKNMPSYFRITANEGFANLNGSYHYSQPVEIKASTGELMDLSGIVSISPYRK